MSPVVFRNELFFMVISAGCIDTSERDDAFILRCYRVLYNALHAPVAQVDRASVS